MKNKLFIIAGAILAMAATAHATKITGNIDMGGTATLDSQLLGSATKVTSFSSVRTGDGTGTGTFAGLDDLAVTWNAFGWNPSTTPVNPLWTFNNAGITYTLVLNNVSVDSQDNSFLNLLGSGVLSATGYEDTAASWSFTISNSGGGSHANFKFTFANSQTAAVPDGGTTVMLLGAGLSCLGLIRRKLVA